MPTSISTPLIDIPEAVAVAIAAATLSQPAVVTREYLTEIELGDLGATGNLDVRVYPGPLVGTLCDRTRNSEDVTVKIAIRKKLTSLDNAAIDPLLAYVQELADFLRGFGDLNTTPKAVWNTVEFPLPYFPEHLRAFRQFTSVLHITYRTFRPWA